MSLIATSSNKRAKNSLAVLEFIGERRRLMHQHCCVSPSKLGLEISPNWAPLVLRNEAHVVYCDRLTTEQLVEREKGNSSRIHYGAEVEDMDFIWKDGTKLASYFSPHEKFDFIVSSHVLEHVPNFIGFIDQQRAILKDDGYIGFVLPDVRRSGEYFRPLTTPAQLIDALIIDRTMPSPGMVYEATYHIFDWPGEQNFRAKSINETKRGYTDKQAVEFARISAQEYIDVHCWAFTYATFRDVLAEVSSVGLFDYDVAFLGQHAEEIICVLQPKHAHAGAQRGEAGRHIAALEAEISRLQEQLARARG